MKQVMAVHGAKCDKSDLMCDKNKKNRVYRLLPFSIIPALEDGFSIVMYSGIHDTNMYNSCVHRNHAVRLILNKGQEDIKEYHDYMFRGVNTDPPQNIDIYYLLFTSMGFHLLRRWFSTRTNID